MRVVVRAYVGTFLLQPLHRPLFWEYRRAALRMTLTATTLRAVRLKLELLLILANPAIQVVMPPAIANDELTACSDARLGSIEARRKLPMPADQVFENSPVTFKHRELRRSSHVVVLNC